MAMVWPGECREKRVFTLRLFGAWNKGNDTKYSTNGVLFNGDLPCFNLYKMTKQNTQKRSKATVTMSFQTNQRLGFKFFDHSKPAEEYFSSELPPPSWSQT